MNPHQRPCVRFCHLLFHAQNWQKRPEFEELKAWWQAGATGVFVMTGVGGSGKTALVNRLLRVVPGITQQDPAVPKDRTLRPLGDSGGIFVFSFSEGSNPEMLFDCLYDWLLSFGLKDERSIHEGVRRRATGMMVETAIGSLREPLVIVIDGLERVQSSGPGQPGAIEDESLRSFFMNVAAGTRQGVSLLITSQFPLTDLESGRTPLCHHIFLDRLQEDQSVALMRACGAKGSDDELLQMARNLACHPLALELVAGIMAISEGARPKSGTSVLALSQQLETLSNDYTTPERRGLALTSRRLRLIATWYRNSLAASDPAAIALLERMCLLRIAVGSDFLCKLFLRKNWLDRTKRDISTNPLSRLTATELQQRLDRLQSLHLIEQPSTERYRVHGALRDAFVSELSIETQRVVHGAVCTLIDDGLPMLLKTPAAFRRTGLPMRPDLLATLTVMMRPVPIEPELLDYMEEWIYHTVSSGHIPEAWRFYCKQLLGYDNIAMRAADFARGLRLCRLFMTEAPLSEAEPIPGFDDSARGRLLNECGLYQLRLGDVRSAKKLFERASAISQGDTLRGNFAVCLTNLAYAHLLLGELPAARHRAEQALQSQWRGDTGDGADFLALAVHRYAIFLSAPREIPDSETGGEALERWQTYASRVSAFGPGDPSNYSSSITRARLRGTDETLRYLTCWPGEIPVMCDLLAGPPTEVSSLHAIEEVAKTYRQIVRNEFGSQSGEIARADELMLCAKLAKGDDVASLESALVRLSREIDRLGDRELLCRVKLLDANACLAQASVHQNQLSARIRLAQRGLDTAEEALRVAQEGGYSLLFLDLCITKARLNLQVGRAAIAQSDAVTAIEGLADLGLRGASSPDCRYTWGESAARTTLAEAIRLEAFQQLQSAELATTSVSPANGLPEETISRIRKELAQCKTLEENRVTFETRCALEAQLDSGEMQTPYPLAPLAAPPVLVNADFAGDTQKLSTHGDPIALGIVIALLEEFRSLHEQIVTLCRVYRDPTTAYHYYFFDRPIAPASRRRCAALFAGEMGPEKAALATKRFLDLCSPRVLANIGIAGATSGDLRLGDVVVASQVDAYLTRAKIHGEGTGLELSLAGEAFHCDVAAVRDVRNIEFTFPEQFRRWQTGCRDDGRREAGLDAWNEFVDAGLVNDFPCIQIGHIASGPVVAASATYVQRLKDRDRSLLGIEMEAAGVMAAVWDQVQLKPTIVLKGMSDFSDERKTQLDSIGGGIFRRIAMRNCLRFLWLLLECGICGPEPSHTKV